MLASKPVIGSLLLAATCGCTTLYDARISLDSQVQRDAIDHCLASLQFSDISSQSPFPDIISEDPDLREVWGTPTGTGWSQVVFSRAYLSEEESGWLVRFVPSSGHGHEAKYFAHSFAGCLELHGAASNVEVTSERFVDLR